MNETTNQNVVLHGLRQSLVVTVILLLLGGFVYPILLSGISAVLFPSQAKGSLVYADGKAVGVQPDRTGLYGGLFHEVPPFGLQL